ncbi:MarR family winged helix-turn-helix transcriptional regulator [Actinomadura rudentiformis]|uniref:MarR family winged helix-turn-helix transcriptional regulator n=1 Tax=Actinomadura rudentiformis TaxID=359158 RepID=UPI00178C50D1|nr:MarR family winged helix-turn-helix transcriptional regulator [Actinomadura rudentiformis]
MDFERADTLNGAIRTIALKHRARAAVKLAELGLHPGHEAVLFLLSAKGPQTQRQLAAGADCEPPSITLMVRKLEAAGLVSRAPAVQDARANVVRLTAEGEKVILRMKELWRELADETVASLTDTSADELITALTDLARGLQGRTPEDESAGRRA